MTDAWIMGKKAEPKRFPTTGEFYQFLFILTRRVMSEGGFLTTK